MSKKIECVCARNEGRTAKVGEAKDEGRFKYTSQGRKEGREEEAKEGFHDRINRGEEMNERENRQGRGSSTVGIGLCVQ
jgi:hypothetical protein